MIRPGLSCYDTPHPKTRDYLRLGFCGLRRFPIPQARHKTGMAKDALTRRSTRTLRHPASFGSSVVPSSSLLQSSARAAPVSWALAERGSTHAHRLADIRITRLWSGEAIECDRIQAETCVWPNGLDSHHPDVYCERGSAHGTEGVEVSSHFRQRWRTNQPKESA